MLHLSAGVENRGAPALTEDRVSGYETAFAAAVGERHAVAFSHGRVALRSILEAAGVRPGEEVVLSPLTCKVVPLALLSLGLSPVYADIGPTTLNLGADSVAAACTRRTRAIFFQCTYGSMDGREEVADLASRKQVLLIEDRAQCMPIESHPLLGRGVAAIYSNNLIKPLPAGSGGLAVTSDDSLAQRLTDLRQGLPAASGTGRIRTEVLLHRWFLRPASYWLLLTVKRVLGRSYRSRPVDREVETEVTGIASRISSYQGQLGLDWLDRLDELVRHRHGCCADYENELKGQADLVLPAAGSNEPLYYYPVVVSDKQKLLEEARRRRLELIAWPSKTPIFPIDDPDHLPAYGYRMGQCERADRLAGGLVGLPTHEHATAPFRRRLTRLIIQTCGTGSSDARGRQ